MACARGRGMPVISTAGFSRRGDLGLLVPVSPPIKAPADIKGKRLVYTAGSMEAPFLDAFFTKAGLTRDQVQLVQVDASAKVPTYLNEGVDGVFTSTAFTLALVEAKKPTRSVLFADFDLNLPGFGVLTTEGMLKKKGDALRKFASISSGAWAYVLAAHEDEAGQTPLTAPDHQRPAPLAVARQPQ